MKKVRIPKLYGRKPFSKSAYGDNWSSETQSIKQRDGNKCVRCGSSCRLQTHHIVPISKGGTNHPFNLITLCENCHEGSHVNNMSMRKNNRKRRIG